MALGREGGDDFFKAWAAPQPVLMAGETQVGGGLPAGNRRSLPQRGKAGRPDRNPLQLFSQTDIDEATSRIIGKVCVVDAGIGPGRIVAENISATKGESGATEQVLPGLSRVAEAPLVRTLNIKEPGLFNIVNLEATGLRMKNMFARPIKKVNRR